MTKESFLAALATLLFTWLMICNTNSNILQIILYALGYWTFFKTGIDHSDWFFEP